MSDPWATHGLPMGNLWLTHEQVVVAVIVVTSTHRYNAVRGHRTGSNNSGAEDYLRRKNK